MPVPITYEPARRACRGSRQRQWLIALATDGLSENREDWDPRSWANLERRLVSAGYRLARRSSGVQIIDGPRADPLDGVAPRWPPVPQRQGATGDAPA